MPTTNTPTMNELARQVAELIDGWTWQPTDRHDAGFLTREDGATIRLWQNWDDPRVDIGGLYPDTVTVTDRPRISCAIKLGPAHIAGHIQRRFIPKYEEKYTRARATADSYERTAKRQRETARKLAAILGVEPRVDEDDVYHTPLVSIRGKGRGDHSMSVTLEVHSTDVDFAKHSYVPPSLAERLCQTIRDWLDEQEEG